MSLWRDGEGRVRTAWVLLCFAALAGGLEVAGTVVLALFGPQTLPPLDDARIAWVVLPTLVSAGVASAVCRWWFQVPVGLATPHPARHLALGGLLGGLALLLACGVPAALGHTALHAGGAGSVVDGLQQLLTLAPAGGGEELLLRGLAFEALRRGAGARVAVAASGLVFGVLHLLNPHASPVAAAIIALVGLWFALLRLRSGAVWLPIGTHVGWNFFEGFVFGQPVSGMVSGRTWLTASTGTPGFWSGGAFGPEAAGWTAVVLGAAVLVAALAGRRSLTRQPQ